MKITWFVVVLCVGLALCGPSFNKHRRSSVNGNGNMPRRKRAVFVKKLWINNEIPYRIDGRGFDAGQIATIKDAMRRWESVSCVRFVERQEEHLQGVVFLGTGGCQSYIGATRFAEQPLYLGRGCFRMKGIVLHELGHVLGLLHEHSRPDRDKYVNVTVDVWDKYYTEYVKASWKNVLTFGLPYDYLSVMHYKDSTKTTMAAKEKTSSSDQDCFPGDGQLLLDNGNMVDMKDLSTGHRVLTVQAGRRVFTEVKTFLKRYIHQNTTYRTLITEQGHHVTMSYNHLIFASATNTSANMESRFAMSVKPGDYIFTTKACGRDLCPERVVQVSVSLKQGLYVPVTDAGTLVVNGIFASCYASCPHHLGHLFVSPFRWFPWLLDPWQQDGYSPIISGLEYLASRFLPMSLSQGVKTASTSQFR
ncbi:indian hedgehog protein-like [Gigantopelta aegis]|uniref:indian hedgehog protein-like n=1 Tax=Gigantopelta aegis TaxID=1735272 RepID=UPI001B887CBC|nr:indian hedgehog protein-like [Gigantopelta aegis]